MGVWGGAAGTIGARWQVKVDRAAKEGGLVSMPPAGCFCSGSRCRIHGQLATLVSLYTSNYGCSSQDGWAAPLWSITHRPSLVDHGPPLAQTNFSPLVVIWSATPLTLTVTLWGPTGQRSTPYDPPLRPTSQHYTGQHQSMPHWSILVNAHGETVCH